MCFFAGQESADLKKDDANRLLRRGIRALQGKAFRARPEVILQHVLVDLEELEVGGWWWQAGILQFWIHRFQGGEFTRPDGRDPCLQVGEDSPEFTARRADLLDVEEEGSL